MKYRQTRKNMRLAHNFTEHLINFHEEQDFSNDTCIRLRKEAYRLRKLYTYKEIDFKDFVIGFLGLYLDEVR